MGNVDPDTSRMDLRKLFEAHGIVEDVEVKQTGLATNYSFVKYEDMDMSGEAKRHLTDQLVGNSKITIGYGNGIFFVFFFFLF